jgi:hypothetical protein
MAGTEDVDRGMAHDQENPVRDELEVLRVALQRLGFDLDNEALAKLAPQVSAILDNGSSIAKLDLSGIEPVIAFDARWSR